MVAIKNLLIAVAAFAVTVYAAPSWGNSGSSDSTGSTGSSGSTNTPGSTDGSNTASSGQTTLGDAAQQCGSNKNVSCCNSATDDSGVQVSDLLGGNCSPLDLELIGLGVPLNSVCSDQTACCSVAQDGLVNVGCVPLQIQL